MTATLICASSFKFAGTVDDAAVWRSILPASSSSLGSRARIRTPGEMRPKRRFTSQ